MKTIKTITCQHVYNYGASLQAFALQHFLEVLGNNVEIINFNPWFHRDRYNPFWLNPLAKGKIVTIMRVLPPLRYILQPYRAYKQGMFKTWGRKEAFDKFERDYYHLSKQNYHTSDDLKNNPPEADVYIAGSDQIWNTYCNNGKEPAYYLDFGSNNTKRLSYAASFATEDIKQDERLFVESQLKNFDSISVRERTGAEIIGNLGIKNVSVVLDPVFLLSSHEWRQLSNKGKMYGLKSKSYLLVYDFLGNDEQMISFVKRYAKLHSLQIVSINDFYPREYADVNINDAGPLEFLAMIDNAACVIANSFHATAFSVIFNVEFYTFSLKGFNNSSRMQDFLKSCNLLNRMNTNFISDEYINWDDVMPLLERLKKYSMDFLYSNI